MKSKLKNALRSLWSRPDPVLAEAGVAGELLVAKIRLILATVLLLIPVLDSLFFPVEPKEAIVGLSLAAGTFLGSIIIYLLISREYNPSWLSFASSSFDVTLISAACHISRSQRTAHSREQQSGVRGIFPRDRQHQLAV